MRKTLEPEIREAKDAMRPSKTQILIYALVLATVLLRIAKEMWDRWGP